MNILEEANKITSGDRRQSYGNPKESCGHIAKIASAILLKKITPHDIVIILLALKLAREQYKPKRDNRVDIAGYAWVLNEVHDDRK